MVWGVGCGGETVTMFEALVTVHHDGRVKREKSTDATNLMFIIKLLSQHVSGIIMPIIRRTRPVLLHMVFCTVCAGCGCVELGRKLCALCESRIVTFTQCTQLTT